MLSKDQLLELNQKMVEHYNYRDKKDLPKINSLQNVNEYDLYLIVCALCNYTDIDFLSDIKDDLIQTRSELFSRIDFNKDYTHKFSEYEINNDIACKNLNTMNKYSHYEFEINSTDQELVSGLWRWKDQNCLKYVSREKDRIVVSAARDQILGFMDALTSLGISYDKQDIINGIFYDNKSNNSLVDWTKYDLPFEPFDYQIEDAKHLIKMNRALLGHEMGCIDGSETVSIKIGSNKFKISLHDLYELFKTGDAKNIKILAYNFSHFVYLPIKKVKYSGTKRCMTFASPYTKLTCTHDHEILTVTGWKEAGELELGDAVLGKHKRGGVEFHEVVEIKDEGLRQTYDIIIDDLTTRNFVCNDIVVHNCGKTFISILLGESINKPKLVICLASLRLNWKKEILQVNPDLDVQILLSSDEYRTGKDWTIISYHTATKFTEQLKEFDCIIIDEVHKCKAVNSWGKPTSKRAKAVLELANNATYCYMLSGTPVPSQNWDLFNIMKMLKSDIVDFNSTWAFRNFADRFCGPVKTKWGYNYHNTNSDELHAELKPLMVRRLKRDVLPNLKKQRQFIPVEPKLTRAYKDVEKRLYRPQENDTYMGLAMTGRKMMSELKVDTAIDLAESMVNADLPVVIVTNFINTADKLKAHFKSNACEIRGGISDKAKQKAIENFQAGKKKVCILNMEAGGVGITLTASSNMIFLDYAWLPADNIQAEDRICRPGQNETANIYYVYAENSIFDRLFVKLLSEKAENISLVVDNEENQFDLEKERKESSTYLQLLKQEISSTKQRK